VPTLWLANTYDIDLIIASPQQALTLAELQQKITHYPLTALKAVLIGAAAISAEGVQRIKRHLCRNVILNYTSTEAGAAAIAPYDAIAHIPHAVGLVSPGAEVQIVDAEHNVMPAGTEGFVRLRTTQFLANFQIDDANTWFYPGDIGWLTAEGALCIAGRTGDVINRGGVKFSVDDFDDFLRSCAGVKDAGVCKSMGDSGFEEIWAGIVLEPSADIATLRQTIDANTEFGTSIDRLFVVEIIPRSPIGKVQREELKKMLQGVSEDDDC
jgi:acyl-coenzyme A synthetase/AMP-(fatty) acid ligase